MSQKRKRGLQDSLSNIINRQNAPISDKTKMSANLLAIFAPAEKEKPVHIDEDAPLRLDSEPQNSIQPRRLPTGPKKTQPVARVVKPTAFKENSATAHEQIAPTQKPVSTFDGTKVQSFSEFSTRWSPFLRPAQLAVCRAIWDMTYALGKSDCFSSMAKLAAAAKLSERQCYRTVEQLERRGFVEKPEVFNTATTKGTVFFLHSTPIQPHMRRKRIYHIGE